MIQLIRTSDNAAAAKERLMAVFDLTEVQADYILDMPLRRLTKFSRIELEKEQCRARARDRASSTRSSATTSCCAKVVSDELARGRQDLRHPAAHGAARVGRHRRVDRRGRAARGRRRPVLRLPVLHRAARPHRRRRAARRRAAAAPTTTSSCPAVRATARGEIGGAHLGRPAGRGSACSTCRAARHRQRPPPRRRRCRVSEVLVARARRARCSRCARWRPTGPASRSAPARASSSGSTPRCSAETTGR